MRKVLLYILPVLVILSLISHLNGIKLRAEEPRRAMVAIESMETGNYLVPQLNGESYYNKPPLYNWVLAGFFHLTGSTGEWAVRLPGILSLVLLAFFAYRFSIPYLGRESSFLIFLFTLTAADIYFYGSVNAGEIDLFYSLLVFLQVMAIFVNFRSGRFTLMFLLSYLLTAAGFLTKGLPSLAFQALTMLTLLVVYRKTYLLFSWRHFSGILLFLMITVVYFKLYDARDDALGYLVNLVKESSKKSFNESSLIPVIQHIFEFPLTLIKILFPWSLLILLIPWNKRLYRENELYRFSLVFLIPNILIYWFSPDTRERYLYMFVPFILYILVLHYHSPVKSKIDPKKWVHYIMILLSILAVLGLLLTPFLDLVPVPRSGFIPVSLTFALLAALLVRLQIKGRGLNLYFMAATMILLRFYLNILLIPSIEKDSRSAVYARNAEEIAEAAQGGNIHLTGAADILSPDISFFGRTLYSEKLQTAPVLGYEFYYYYYRNSGRLLKFKENPSPGEYGILYEEDLYSINENFSQILIFDNLSNRKKMMMIRIE